MPKVGTELPQENLAEQVGENKEAAAEEVKAQLEAEHREVGDFLHTVAGDLAKIDGDESPEAQEFKVGLLALQQEAETLKKGVWQHVADIVKAPVLYIRNYFEARHEEALRIPDNQKIISQMKQELRRIQLLRYKLQKKLVKQGVKSSDAYTQTLHEPEFCQQFDDAYTLFDRAHKQDPKKWEDMWDDFDRVYLERLFILIESGRLPEALVLWGKLSDAEQEKRVGRIVETIFDHEMKVLKQGDFAEPKVTNLFTRKQQFDQWFQKVVNSVSIPYLHETMMACLDSQTREVFSYDERFLLSQPEQCVFTLGSLEENIQKQIIEEWKGHGSRRNSELWTKVLSHPEGEVIARVYIRHPIIKRSISVEKISEMMSRQPLDTIVAAFEKVSQKYPDYVQLTEPEFEGVVAMASCGISADTIVSLDRIKLESIGAVSRVYTSDQLKQLLSDDAILDYQELIPQHIFQVNKDEDIFAKKMSPAVSRFFLGIPDADGGVYNIGKRNGRQINLYDGIQGKVQAYVNFQRILACIPEQFHEEVCERLTPDNTRVSEQVLSEEYVKNFLYYYRELAKEMKLSFYELFNDSGMFVGERWQKIEKGITVIKEEGLLQKIQDKKYSITLLESAGNAARGEINTFVASMLRKNDEMVDLEYGIGNVTQYKKRERTNTDILGIYEFANSCQKVFAKDTKEMVQFFGLEEFDLKIILSFLSGVFETQEYIDLPIVEGEMVGIGHTIQQCNPEFLERMLVLDTKQKQTFLGLRDIYKYTSPDELFVYTEDGRGEKIIASNSRFGFSSPPKIEHALVLSGMENPGILYYFHSIINESISDEIFQEVITKCQELEQLGLPQRYFLAKPADQEQCIGYRNDDLKTFLTLSAEFIVRAANLFEVHGLQQSLLSFIYLDVEDTSQLELRIRSGRVERINETISRYTHIIPEESLKEIEVRFANIQEMHPGIVISQFDFRYMQIDQETWARLLIEPVILRWFMESPWKKFPGFSVPKDILEQPFFWEVEVPHEIYHNPVLLARHFSFLRDVKERHLTYTPPKDSVAWISLYDTLDHVRTIFGEEIMQHCPLDLLDRYTKTDTEKFVEFTALFSHDTDWPEVGRTMKRIGDWTPEKKALAKEIRILCGTPIPCKIAQELDELMDKYQSAEEILAQMDSGDQYSYYQHKWAEFRLQTNMPEFTAERYPVAHKIYRGNEMVSHLALLKEYDEIALQHLEQLAVFANSHEGFSPYRYVGEQLLFIAKQPTFDLVFAFIKGADNDDQSVIRLSLDELREFCDAITPDTLASVIQINEHGKIDFKDVPAFLRYPDDVQRFVAFAKKMYGMFGKKISIQDFYLMDVERISQTLDYLEEHALSQITELNLKRMLAISEGDVQSDLRLVLASFDNKQAISTEEAIEKLQTVPKEFQWSILKSKSANFGWELLNKTDQLYQLGLTEGQFEELWVSLYEKVGLPDQMPLDARTASILVKQQRDYDQYGVPQNKNVVRHVLEYRKDSITEYHDLFRARKQDVGHSMKYMASESDVWADDVCLSLFLETNFEGFISRLSTIKKEFIFSHGAEIIAQIKSVNAKSAIDFFVQCQKEQIIFSPEDQAALLHEVYTQTLTSHANDCRYLLDQSLQGSVVLSSEQKIGLVDRYLLAGGFLPDQQEYDVDNKKELDTMILDRAELLVRTWKENTNAAVTVLAKFLGQKKFTSEHLDILHAIMEKTDMTMDSRSNADIYQVFVEYLIYIDPTIKEMIHNEKKLGRLKDIVIKKIIEYIQALTAAGGMTREQLHLEIHKKLQQISRVFGSTNTKESDKRLIFMDMYNLKQCNDPAMKELSAEDIAIRLRKDTEEVILLSGSGSQRQSIQREWEITDDPEKKEELQKKLATVSHAIEQAELRNRQLRDFLPPGALTHGMPSQYLELALEYGNLSGELLGSSTKTDVSGLLGVDVSKVIGEKVGEQSFFEKYKTLRNYGYGDIVLVYGEYANKEREPYYSGAIGNDHYLVRGGIPTTEVTSIILRENKPDLLEKTKKDIATKGMYIPLVDKEGTLLFTTEDYDRMRVFYYSLNKKGYPRAVIDHVYAYVASEKGEKHQVVMDAVQAYVKSDKGNGDVDLAVLVDFLRSNDLNERSVEWYKEQSFEMLYVFIKKTVGRKKRGKARATMLGKEFAAAFDQRLLRGENITVQPEKQRNAFIDAFLERQVPFVYGDGDAGAMHKKVFENDLTDMLFREKTPAVTLEIANRFSEFKKEFMRTLWNKAWEKIHEIAAPEDDGFDYKKYIVPAVVGSVGRGEVVLGSDLDYLLYVDDVSEPISGEQLNVLKQFINNKLGPIMNQLLEEQGIHADAGLAKADRLPFTLLSTIRDFKIDLTQQRQVEEPTNMLDSEALLLEQSSTVERAKELLLVENKTAHYLDSYIAKDLEIGTNTHPGYQVQFEKLYTSVASGELMTRVKESLQRAVVFKLYFLIFEGFNSGKIPKELAISVPASVGGKIDLLTEYSILSQTEARTCRELVAFAYKLRFLGEVYSDEAKQQKQLADKVANVKFKLDDISYDERVTLIGLLKDFKSTVLYK